MFLIILFSIIIALLFTQVKHVDKTKSFEVIFASIAIMVIAMIMAAEITETLWKRNAIKNNAAYWDVTTDKISGKSTKEFKWGQKKSNEHEEIKNDKR